MRRALDTVYNAAAYLAAFFIFLIFILMIGQSIAREAGVRTGAVNDIVAWLCAGAAFLAMASSFRNGDFVRVSLLLERLPARAMHRFELATLSIATLAIGYLAFWAVRFTYESYVFGDTATGLLAMPLWIPQLSFAIGSVLFLVAVLDELLTVLRGRRPTYVTAVEERHARGDFSEDV